ncbi:MAG TPA: 4-alpha-glucanotransferase [Blastocatellia bacterium]|nr:4-alpha-glucanotransferase [Blastocatellia bacterium]
MIELDQTNLFATGYRASGVMLDITALPSPYGIGDVGPVALKWIDRLRDSGQSWWHALESLKSGYPDSAYQCYSSFAGNVLLISPDWLIEDGLLTRQDCDCVSFPSEMIDFDVVVPFKHWLLDKAWKNFNRGSHKELLRLYEQFRKRQCHWLEDYGLFEALKARYRGTHCSEWPASFGYREPEAIANARHELAGEIDRVRFSQFLLFRQSRRLKEYARAKGVTMIGDISYNVSDDSSEAWTNPELFVRDENATASSGKSLMPIWFGSSGGLGPDHHHGRDSGVVNRVSHRWCADRLRALLAHVDVCRVDVPAVVAPSHEAAGVPVMPDSNIRSDRFLQEARLIAHDITVRGSEPAKLLETRVLQFAFNGCLDNPHLPRNFDCNSVVYTGSNGDARTRQWFEALPKEERQGVWNCLNRPAGETSEVAWELIRLAWSSRAALSIVSVPDLLNLGTIPLGQPDVDDHKSWRCTEEMLAAPVFYWLREMTRASNRSSEVTKIARTSALRTPRRRARIEAAL